MTQNVTELWPEILAIAGGAGVLLLFALAIALPHRPRTLPGSQGHRKPGDEAEHEEIRPDSYIDSFAGEIEEAGGGLPWAVRLALVGVILWWLVYLILNWTQR
jgi:hypothetical protein